VSNQLGDGPIQPEFLKLMNALAATIDEVFNGKAKGAGRKTGFVLLVFPFDEVEGKNRCNYISNADRKDVVTMLKQQVRRFEGQPDVSGRA